MNGKKCGAIGFLIFALVFPFAALRLSKGQDTDNRDKPGAYPEMSPLEQYLMDRNAEIAPARSAARKPYPVMPQCWFLAGMVMKPLLQERTASYASWSARGCFPSTIRNSGIPACVCRSAKIPPPRDHICHSLSRRQSWYWPGGPGNRCSTALRPHSTRKNCPCRSMARGAT